MPESERSQELAEADFDWLDSMLSRVVGGRIPNVEALDGFMTALVVSPDLIKPSEYVPIIVSGKTEDGGLVFESADEVLTDSPLHRPSAGPLYPSRAVRGTQTAVCAK